MIFNKIIESRCFGYSVRKNLLYIIVDGYSESSFNLYINIYDLNTRSLINRLYLGEDILFNPSDFAIDVSCDLNMILFKSRFTNLNICLNNKFIEDKYLLNPFNKLFNINMIIYDSYVFISYEYKNFIDIFLLTDFTLKKRIISTVNSFNGIPKMILDENNKYLCLSFSTTNDYYPISELIIIDLITFEIIKSIKLDVYIENLSFKPETTEILYLYSPLEYVSGLQRKNTYSIGSYNFVSDIHYELINRQKQDISSFIYINKITSIIIIESDYQIYLIDSSKNKIKINFEIELLNEKLNGSPQINITDDEKYILYMDNLNLKAYELKY